MKISFTKLEGVIIIEPLVHYDNRGWFYESYNYDEFKKAGIEVFFLQDNHSFSKQKGILRGIHIQNEPYSQTKLVRCTKGRIFDVAVDLRKSSPTYLEWIAVELSDSNMKQLLIPKGFGHAFLTLEDYCEVQYKVDMVYHSSSDMSIRFDDPAINIEWPFTNVILSEKDKNAPFLCELEVIPL